MKFTKHTLDNGLTILHEQRDVPVTTVMLAAKYGAAYEKKEEKGMAHFMEHLCFKGTTKRNAKQIAEEVENLGGNLNAFTHEEVTAYHVKLPSQHLSTAMDVIFDIFFNPTFPQEEFNKEANVICEEIKMYRDNPRTHVLDNIKHALYQEPFGSFIAGTEQTVKSMTRTQLLKAHRTYYTPNNTILCVVGNNNYQEVEQLAKKLCVTRKGTTPTLPPITTHTKQRTETRQGISQANLALGIHLPYNNEQQKYTAEVFSSILGGGMSSKLFTEVREKRGLVYAVKSDIDLGKHYGYLLIWAGTDNENINKVKKLCEQEFANMKNLTEQELKQGKIQLLGNRDVEKESSSDVAVNLIMEELQGNAKEFYHYEQHINNVTLKDIQQLTNNKNFSFYALHA